MNEMQDFYYDLKRKRRAIAEELNQKKKQLGEIPGRKQSIVIKKIHGELYYYAQWSEAGRVKSRFLTPVSPGIIAQEEKVQATIEQLNRDVKELQASLDSLDKMIGYLDRQRKKEKLLDNFTFEVYWKDEITARVYVKTNEVIVSRFTDHPVKQLFAQNKMTRYQLGKIFELRCWEKERPDNRELLRYLGLTEYNPYEIIRKTHGVSYNDYIWFRFPGEKITSKDVLVRS